MVAKEEAKHLEWLKQVAKDASMMPVLNANADMLVETASPSPPNSYACDMCVSMHVW